MLPLLSTPEFIVGTLIAVVLACIAGLYWVARKATDEPRPRIRLAPDSRQEIPVYEELRVVEAQPTPTPAPTPCARCGKPVTGIAHYTSRSGPFHGGCLLHEFDDKRGAA